MASSSSSPLNFQNFSLAEYLAPKPTRAIEDLTQHFSGLQVSSSPGDWPSWPSEPPEPVPSPLPTLPFFTASTLAVKFFHYYNHPLNSTTKFISSQIFPRPWDPTHIYQFGQGIGYQIEIVMPPNPHALSASPQVFSDSDSDDALYVPSESEHSSDTPSDANAVFRCVCAKPPCARRMMNAWLSVEPPPIASRILPDPLPPFVALDRQARSRLVNSDYQTSFEMSPEFFTEDFEKDVTRVDYSVDQLPVATVAAIELDDYQSRPVHALSDLHLRGPWFSWQYPDYTVTRCYFRQAVQLLAAFSNKTLDVLFNPTAFKNFKWACRILNESYGVPAVVHREIQFVLDTLPSILSWYQGHTTELEHLRSVKEQYEGAREHARVLLDEIIHFEDTYIYGVPSYDDEDLTQAEAQDRMDEYEDLAKEAYVKLRNKDYLALELKEKHSKIHLEASYFDNYWVTFHSIVTFGIPFFHMVRM